MEGLRLLMDAHCSTKNGKLKVQALREEGLNFFEDILEEGLKSL